MSKPSVTRRRSVLRDVALRALVACVCAAALSPAFAQTWPDKPIRLIVSAGPGSSLDALARTIADKLKERVGQPVIVENKPAAGGTVAMTEVARAASDGYTMGLGFNGPLAFGPLLQKLPYDVSKDLAPVIVTSSQPNVLAVNAQLPVKTLKELVAYAKANPGKLAYASVGNGSSSHLAMEFLKSVAGFDALHVPFNGSPPAVTATIQNETQMMFAVMQPLQPQIQAGKLRAIAVTTAKRFRLLPDLPAIAESGYPGFEALAWNGIVMPAATPKPIVARLNADIDAILKEPEVLQKMHALGFDLIGGPPDALAKLIRDETAQWTPVIRKLGLRVD
jgi:tripartite-type tricarboxylate transporter receptor subunit TctC